MSAKHYLAELEHEVVSTGKLLQSIPADKLKWQPHAKAMTLGELALHVAAIPGRYLTFADSGTTSSDILLQHPQPTNKDEILKTFFGSIATAKNLIPNVEGKWQGQSWSLTGQNKTLLTLPIPLFMRLLVFNHWMHHRGQLSSYLRTLGVPVPSIYGPSADENPFS